MSFDWVGVLLPSLLIVLGLSINILTNIFDSNEAIYFFSMTIPWLFLIAYFKLPGNQKHIYSLWDFSFLFFTLFTLLGLIEYLLFYNLHLISFRPLVFKQGPVLSGLFSILHQLEDGRPHDRFYSIFSEPGTYAMWIFPFILYGIYKRKFISVIILTAGFLLSRSLGGYVALILAAALLIVRNLTIKTSRLVKAFSLIIVLISFMLLIPVTSKVYEIYDTRTGSKESRLSNLTQTFTKLPINVIENPRGIKLHIDTNRQEKVQGYISSNSMFSVYYQVGGILSLLGYLLFISVNFLIAANNFFKKEHPLGILGTVSSLTILILPLYLLQRTTFLESALFSMLFITPLYANKFTANHTIALGEI